MSTRLNKNNRDEYFMDLALKQAYINLGNTKINPAVGCVITKNNCLISAGHTSINGNPHAEKNAIDLAKTNVRKSNLYVTLEPCSNYGNSPPCLNAIVKGKFNKVYYSIKDPDLRSYSKSYNVLRKMGIKVHEGLFKKKITHFYQSYIKNKKNKLPFVTCKVAVSKDFYSVNVKKKWITNKFSRGRVHLMRSMHDCIITSSNTIIKDNPKLNCRISGLEDRSPSIIILDKHLRIPLKSNVIYNAKKTDTVIIYNSIKRSKIKLLKKLNIKTYKIKLDKDSNIDLKNLLFKIKKLGFSRIFLECGVKLTTNFLQQNLIDEFKLFFSNHKIKNMGRENIKKYFKLYLNKKKFFIESVNLMGDKLLSYKLK